MTNRSGALILAAMIRLGIALFVAAVALGCGASPPSSESLADTPPHRDEVVVAQASPHEPSLNPSGDEDGDRIINVCDECVNEPELFNGNDDEDGCPDRGDVLLIDEHIRLLERIFFVRNSDRLAAGDPTVQAVAATLQGNPQLLVIGVVGHAAANERNPHDLARHRAETVQQRLIALGVSTTRLVIYESGSADPVTPDQPNSENNRNVSFAVMQTADRVFNTWDGTRMNELPIAQAISTPLEMHRIPLTEAQRAECTRLTRR